MATGFKVIFFKTPKARKVDMLLTARSLFPVCNIIFGLLSVP